MKTAILIIALLATVSVKAQKDTTAADTVKEFILSEQEGIHLMQLLQIQALGEAQITPDAAKKEIELLNSRVYLVPTRRSKK